MKKENPVVSIASNFITSNVSLLISLLTGIIVTRALGPDLKGEYAALKLVLTLYAPLFLLGYQGSVLFYALKKRIDIREFFWTGALLCTGIGVAIVPLILFLIQKGAFGEVAQGVDTTVLKLGLINVPIIFLNAYSERVLRSFHLFRASNQRFILSLTVTFLYFLALYFTKGINLTDAMVGVLIGNLVAAVSNFYFILWKIRVYLKFRFDQILLPFSYGVKSWLNTLVVTSNDRFDQIILGFLLSSRSFGIYVVGVGLSNLVTKLPSSYLSVFYNQIVGKSDKEQMELYAKTQRLTFLVTTAAALVLALLSIPIVKILYGEPFIEAATVMIFYTPGLIFQVAARLSAQFYAGVGKPLKNALIYISGILVGLPFYFLLIPTYGMIGAAIASSISYLAAFGFSFWQINRDYKLSIGAVLIPRKADYIFLKEKATALSFKRRK